MKLTLYFGLFMASVISGTKLRECEVDCDRDSDCTGQLLCADAHKPALKALGKDERKAYCPGPFPDAADPNLEVCFSVCCAGKSFTLWNADTDEAVALYTPQNNDVLCFQDDYKFSISADPSDCGGFVQSAKMTLSGAINVSNVENVFPYTIFDNDEANIKGRDWKVGKYRIVAKFYSEDDAKGKLIDTLTANFEVKVCDASRKMLRQHGN